MSVTYGGVGAVAAGTAASINVTLPATIDAGDLILIICCSKYPSAASFATATDYSQLVTFDSVTGAEGADTGPLRMTVLTKTAVGTEDGATVSVSHGNNNGTWQFAMSLHKSLGSWVTPAYATGEDTVTGATYSATVGSDPGGAAGDYVVAVCGIPTDAQTGITGQSLTWTGTTMGSAVELGNIETNSGDDLGGTCTHRTVTAGPSSAAPSYSATFTSAANAYGPLIVMRFRDTSNLSVNAEVTSATATAPDPDASLGLNVGSSTVAVSSPDARSSLGSASAVAGGSASAFDATADIQESGGGPLNVDPGVAVADMAAHGATTGVSIKSGVAG